MIALRGSLTVYTGCPKPMTISLFATRLRMSASASSGESYRSWISSATLLARYGFARDLTTARYSGRRFKPERLMSLSLSDPGDIVDAVLAALGIADQVTTAERDVFIAYLGGPSASLDLFDYDTRNAKLHGLFALVIQSPVFQTH